MPNVRMPDGTMVRFPDEMPKEQIRELISRKFPARQPQANPQVEAAAMQAQGDPDEIVSRGDFLPAGRTRAGELVPALPGGIKDILDITGAHLRGERGIGADGLDPREVLALGGAGGGGMMARRVGSAPAAKVAGDAIEEFAAPAVRGAERAVVTPARRYLAERQIEVPDTEKLYTMADEAFTRADAAGVRFAPQSFSRMAGGLERELMETGFDTRLHPKSTRVLERMRDSYDAGPPSLRELHVLRRLAQGVAKGTDADETRVASTIIRHIDDLIDNAQPGRDLVGGQGSAQIKSWQDGMRLWKQYRKSEVIDDLMQRAADSAPNYSVSGMENAIRIQFKQLSMNKRKMAQFSAEEQDLIRGVARGGPVSYALRQMGKFAIRGPVNLGVTGGLGSLAFGPAGALALAGGGELARAAAKALTKRNVGKVRRAIGRQPVRPGSSGTALLPEQA